jgi:hypothetical protein
MKKTLLFVITLMLLIALAACAPQADVPEVPDFSVEATATAADVGRSAADLLTQTMDDNGITYTVESGYFDNIGGFASTDSGDGWLFYYNGELPSVGAESITLNEGDTVAFRWGNYYEASGTTTDDGTVTDDTVTDDNGDDTSTSDDNTASE